MIERVEYYDIHHNQEKANITLTNEINKLNNDIYICLEGNAKTFVLDSKTKASLNSLYNRLEYYKKEGKF